MSGLEALSLACNVFQTISFARDTVNFCRDVYNGQKTPDAHLEAQATAMIQAAQQVEASCSGGTLAASEQTLADISRECVATAKKLESMVQSIAKVHKKGKCVSALIARVKSLCKQKDIESLDKTLLGYTNTMQVLLIDRICNQTKASDLKSQAGFAQLDGTLKSFILRIDAGYTKMEDLLKSEANATQAHITRELQDRTRKDEMRRHRERLLGSLRFPEMNQRRSAITDSQDASFEGVFRSYERPAHTYTPGDLEASDQSPSDKERENHLDKEYHITSGDTDSMLLRVDEVWKGFVSWLRSDEPLFWIQGKPGSGKSTLVKHIVTNNATRQLLGEWSPNARVISHYFYLIGSPLQSNITGFYSSLSHQLLEGNELLTDETIRRYPLSTTKHHIGDWSVSELQELLELILDLQDNHGSLCIFIDGLDEYTDKDGQVALLNRLQTIHQRPNVKMCVSSRPEPNLLRRLESEPNLKLHDLTRPEMELYVYAQLRPFLEEDAISEAVFFNVKWELLDKARGVFLWLVLALQSLTNGIHNDDSEQLLMLRLHELPSELEDLYEAMWKRVNEDTLVYRQTGARYLHIMLLFMKIHPFRWFDYKRRPVLQIPDITMFELICINLGAEQMLLEPATRRYLDQVIELYPRTEREIRVQCAGLLEVIPGDKFDDSWYGDDSDYEIKDSLRTWTNSCAAQVRFVHRTAYDFLTTKRGGRSILDHSKITSEELCFSILRASLCLARILHQETELGFFLFGFLRPLKHILEMYIPPMTDVLNKLMGVAQSFYEDDILVARDDMKTHFLSEATRLRVLDTWLLEQLDKASAPTATVVLGEMWPCPDSHRFYSGWDGSLILRKLLSQGGDPFAMRRYHGHFGSATGFNAIQALISYFCFRSNLKESREASIFADAIEAILEAGVPFVDHRWLVFILNGSPIPLQLGVIRLGRGYTWGRKWHDGFWPIYEVTTSVLLDYALRLAESMAPEIKHTMPRVREALEAHHSATATQLCVRYVGRRFTSDAVDPVFYDIVSQEPFEEAIDDLSDFSAGGLLHRPEAPELQEVLEKWNALVDSSTEDPSILKKIRFEEIALQYDMELTLSEEFQRQNGQADSNLD